MLYSFKQGISDAHDRFADFQKLDPIHQQALYHGRRSMPANDKRYMLYNVQVIYDKATCDFFNAVPIPLGQSQGYSELATSGIFPEHIKQDVGELKNEKVSLHIGKTYHSRINTQGA